MADTGAPYFIPYVEPTDLVRDYPAADEASADAIAAALDAIPVLAGIGSNVVQVLKTDTTSATLATGVTSGDIAGLSVTITPSSASSKIFVVCQLSLASTTTGVYAQLFRDGSETVLRGDADGVRIRAAVGVQTASPDVVATAPVVFLDSPATVSAVTYTVRLSHRSGAAQTVFVNRSATDLNNVAEKRLSSTMLVTEVAA